MTLRSVWLGPIDLAPDALGHFLYTPHEEGFRIADVRLHEVEGEGRGLDEAPIGRRPAHALIDVAILRVGLYQTAAFQKRLPILRIQHTCEVGVHNGSLHRARVGVELVGEDVRMVDIPDGIVWRLIGEAP